MDKQIKEPRPKFIVMRSP